MEIFILILVVIGALISITSGIWVAAVLGSALSKDNKKKNSIDNIDT